MSVKLNHKYLFIFAISVFFILSISGAGIFINDEWMVGQQLQQLSTGHQLFTNEGKYGYYTNGSAGSYMTVRSNILIYSMALPIVSLPAFFLFTLLSTEFTRDIIITFWGFLGLFIINCLFEFKILNKKDIGLPTLLKSGIISLTCANIIIASHFVMSGKYVPYEIIPIAFTNILLFGVFAVACFKTTELLFTEKFKQLVSFIACISMNTLIFWCTTLKDHMLLSTMVMIICYLQIQYIQTQNKIHLYILYILSGLTLWIRPEVGLVICIGVALFNIYMNRSLIFLIITSICISIGSLPMWINNYLITGNPLKHPFLISTANQTSGSMVNQLTSGYTQIPFSQLTASSPERWIELIFAPTSGALGLIVPLCLFLFSIIVLIKYRPSLSKESEFLFTIGICSTLYYLLFSGAYLGADGGVIPDIRYFTAAYAPLTLFALSIIPYNLNYRKIFKNIFICIPIVIVIALFLLSIYPPIGESYKTFRMLPHIISTLSLAIMTILLVNDKNDKPNKWMEMIIPVIIASAFTWQVIMVFVYHISKAHYYPMFIPITEIIYKLLFGV